MNTFTNSVKELAFEVFYKMQDYHDNLTISHDANDIRADSIYDGRVGGLFFMLELYKITHEKSIWNSIVDEIKWIENYSAENPTNNYSLFKGKLGLGMFYLKLHEFTSQEDYLNKAVALAKEYYTSNAYFNGIISKYGLFDGIAGVLLFTHELYIQTGHAWLLEHVEKYTLKLLYNCNQGENGIFWGGITNRNYKNNGYAEGNAGIAFVLNSVGSSFNNVFLKNIAQKALAYEKDQLDKRAKDPVAIAPQVLLLSLGYGSFGYSLVQLFTGNYNDKQLLENIKNDASTAEQLCNNINEYNCCGIFSGLSGIGFSVMQAGYLTGDDSLKQSAQRIAEKLVDAFHQLKDHLDFTLNSALGMSSFLLKFIDSTKQHPEFWIMPECIKDPDLLKLPESSIFNLYNKELIETYISSNYKKTLPAIKSLFPDSYAAFINSGDIEMGSFSAFAAKAIDSFDGSVAPDILTGLNKENFLITAIRQLSTSDIYSEADIKNIDRVMSLTPDKFQDLKLVQSKKVIVFSDEDIDIESVKFDKESFINFMQFYGVNSCFYALSSVDSLHMAPLSMLKFIYDRFHTPADIREVCKKVMEFFNKQDQELIDLLKMNFKVTDEDHLRMVIQEYIVEGARYCMTEGLLETLPQ